MEENTPEVDVWEFEAMVDAAAFSALYHEQTEDSFTDQVIEVYLVIERRVREAEEAVAVGVPENNKETTVEDIAEQLEDGFDSAERLARAKTLFEDVPSGSRTNRFEDRASYWKRDDFDPYR